ncbi:sugar ABC transporter substrate-binding protein [Pectinatus sottacetonis]|uniref:sugar ABC transporter substrate-binding protein n=1 Tax=Pectinatus sottacetonis TaxID=1002795 RepID=UPI001E5CBC97|nr:sugar ABC transporter substrate-binding protein [Pectinatus sottacetonis]
MNNKKVLYYLIIIILLAVAIGIATVFIKHVLSQDYSARKYEHRKKFGAVYMTLNNPFYEIINDEIRTTVEKNGDVLLTRDSALSVKRQTREIQELINDGVQILFLNAVDWKKMKPALEIAYKAHVPVIAIDTNVQDEKYVACTVVSDNYEAGVQCAEHMLSHLSGGNIVLIEHSQAKSAVDRINGFTDTIRGHLAFKVIDSAECKGQLELAMPAMEKLMKRHNDIEVVMALNDPAAMGVMAALKNAGRLSKIKVYGVDGAPETKEMIAKGNMTATAAQSPRRLGQIAAEKAYEILAGTNRRKLVELQTILLTKENIDKYNVDGWD